MIIRNILLKLILTITTVFCMFSMYKSKWDFSSVSSSRKVLDFNESKQLVLKFYQSIREKKIYSQNQEDGVILSLVRFLNLSIYNGDFVEFGTENGAECNTRYLREKLNWKGLLMDGSNQNLNINLHQEKILHSNVVSLFKKYNVKKEFVLFSEDTDYADYWIVESVLKEYRPRIVLHEINQQLPDMCVTVPKPNKGELIFWDGSNYHGGSVCAFYCLAKNNGYTMVYCESRGVNCFWIRNDLLEARLGVEAQVVQKILTPNLLYRKPGFVYKSTNKQWTFITC